MNSSYIDGSPITSQIPFDRKSPVPDPTSEYSDSHKRNASAYVNIDLCQLTLKKLISDRVSSNTSFIFRLNFKININTIKSGKIFQKLYVRVEKRTWEKSF